MKYPETPTCYRELRPAGKRAVQRHISGDWILPQIRQDGRLNILWVIAEAKRQKKAVSPEDLKLITYEQKEVIK